MLTGGPRSDRPPSTVPMSLAPPDLVQHNDPVEQLVAIVVLVFRSGRLLAMRRARTNDAAPTLWESVSGRVEPGEDPHTAAAREALEETSLPVTIAERPVDAYAMERRGRPMVVIVYRGDAPPGAVERSDEHDAHEWLSLDEAAARMPPRLARAARAAARAQPEIEP